MSNDQKQYGGFFWLIIISMIVPFFVAAKAYERLQPADEPKVTLDASGVDHQLWDYLLKRYVKNGLVDYNGMEKNALFFEYVHQLASADETKLANEQERLALYCNAYNAFVIHGVIKHNVSSSVMQIVDDSEEPQPKFFDIKEHVFQGKTVSLNDLEHGVIRPRFKEPRIHVALVCAARSCPVIRGEAYFGDKIEQQLNEQSELFANSKTHVSFDAAENKLELSKILKWYGSDFDERFPEYGYYDWIIKHTDSANTKQIDLLKQAAGKKIKTDFVEYNWALNSQSDVGKVGGFGSGSIPNN